MILPRKFFLGEIVMASGVPNSLSGWKEAQMLKFKKFLDSPCAEAES
jgi:hypothetical protein